MALRFSSNEVAMILFRILLSAVVLGFLFLPGCSGDGEGTNVPKTEIVIGLNPSERSEDTQENAELLADLISRKVEMPVKMFVAQDYSGLVEALRAHTIDFAFLAPVSYVYAERIANARVLLKAQRFGSPYYFGSVVVRSDSPYRSLEDLRGRHIAWVDPSSSSGHIFPKAALIDQGFDPETYFARQTFAGGHDAVLLAVINGTIDAGATFANDTLGESGSWTQLEGGALSNRIRPIFYSQPIPADNLATSAFMLEHYPELVQSVTYAVEHMHEDSLGKHVMHSMYHVDAMVPATSADYDPVRRAADALDLDITGNIKNDEGLNSLYSWILVLGVAVFGLVLIGVQVSRQKGQWRRRMGSKGNGSRIAKAGEGAGGIVGAMDFQFVLSDLSMVYRDRSGSDVAALSGLSLKVRRGEFVTVIGPSGAGKSTLLRVLNRSVEPTKGQVFFDDSDVTHASGHRVRELRRRVGFIFQSFNLIPRVTVLRNVLVGRLSEVSTLRSVFGLFPKREVERALAYLGEVDLEEKSNSRAADLSGGQKQRVAIARALAQEPDAILADEPTASLDPILAESILTLLQEINRKHGITIIANLHSTDLARKFGTRIVGLREGTVVFDGSPQDLTEQAIHEIYSDGR